VSDTSTLISWSSRRRRSVVRGLNDELDADDDDDDGSRSMNDVKKDGHVDVYVCMNRRKRVCTSLFRRSGNQSNPVNMHPPSMWYD